MLRTKIKNHFLNVANCFNFTIVLKAYDDMQDSNIFNDWYATNVDYTQIKPIIRSYDMGI